MAAAAAVRNELTLKLEPQPSCLELKAPQARVDKRSRVGGEEQINVQSPQRRKRAVSRDSSSRKYIYEGRRASGLRLSDSDSNKVAQEMHKFTTGSELAGRSRTMDIDALTGGGVPISLPSNSLVE